MQRVTVYSDRAEVSRRAPLALDAAGALSVTVEGLPETVDADTVRVAGGGPFTIEDVSSAVQIRADAAAGGDAEAAAAAVRERIEAAEEEQAALQRAQRRREAERGLRARQLQAATSGWVQPPAVDAVREALQRSRERAEALDTADNAARAEGRALDLRLKALRAELRGLSPRAQGAARHTAVTVQLSVSASGAAADAWLEVTYAVPGAGWRPSYDLRVDSETADIEIQYYGQISQTTGEDWTDVALTLSTAAPDVGGSPPELRQARLQMAPHSTPRMSMSSAPGGGGGGMSRSRDKRKKAKSAKNSMPRSGKHVSASVRGGGGGGNQEGAGSAATLFDVNETASVRSDGQPRRVTVATVRVAATLTHTVVPAKQARAYLKAAATNTSDFPLLASEEVSVFFDSAFVATSALPHVAPGEAFETFVGADENVRVEQAPARQMRSQRGFLRVTRSTSHQHRTTVHNTKQTPVWVSVVQQLPRAADESIRVVMREPAADAVREVASAAAPATEPVEDTTLSTSDSLITWTRRVQPGAKVHIPFEYVVDSAAGQGEVELL